MKNNLILFIFSIFFITLIAPSPAMSKFSNDKPSSVTILASSSLTNVLTELIRIYSIESKTTIIASFNSPSELADSIEAGEEADIYISEHPIKIRDLKRQGLLDVFSLTTLASNKLALVISRKSYLSDYLPPGGTLDDLLSGLNEKTLLVIGDPDSEPIGILTRAILEKLGYWMEIAPFSVRAGSTSRALYLIAKGNMAGIIYYTDAFRNPEIRILSEFPKSLHDPITYQAAVVAGENMILAREVLDFLKSDKASAVFKKYGFE